MKTPSKNMKVLFLRPRPSDQTIGLQHVMLVEPLELEVLATTVQDIAKCVVVDMILEKESCAHIILKEKPNIICVTGYITNIPGMIETCKFSKEIDPEIKTIAGGVHCEVCPEDLDHPAIDFRVVRNATRVFPELLQHLAGKAELPQGVFTTGEQIIQAKLPPFDFYFPQPDRSYCEKYRSQYFYIFHEKVALIKTSFGCPYSCNFCFCREITKKNYAERNLNDVIEELKSIKESNIYIVDDDFLTSRKRLDHFIKLNQKHALNKQYLIYGRADFIAENPDLIRDFSAIGLKTVIVGFESFNEEELRQYNKNIQVQTNWKAMQILNNNKIECYATLIISPSWDKKDFSFLIKQIKRLKIHYVNLQPYTPLPGTSNSAFEDQLIIPRSEYEKWDLAHITVQPEKLSVGEFYKQILRVYNAVLFQPLFLLKYLVNYRPSILCKMIHGSYLVRKQYHQKIKEANKHA